MSKRKFLSLKEFASEVESDPGTVMRAIKKGEILATRLGRNWKIPSTELERFENPKPYVSV